MIFNRFSSATIVASLLLLPACGPQHGNLQREPINAVRTQHTQNDISASAYHMNRADIHQTFGTRGRKLGYYGLCPIQLHIKNNSNTAYIFDPTKTTIEYADHATVANCLKNNTVRDTTIIATLGLAATGIACLYTLPFALWFYITGIGTASLYIGLSSVTGMLIVTPAASIYYAKQAYRANQEITHSMKNMAVTHTRIIPTGQELEVVLFTKKENCKKDFSLSLINEATQEVTQFNFIH